MKGRTTRPAEPPGVHTAPKLDAICYVLDLLEDGRCLSAGKIADRLNLDYRIKRPSKRTIFRYIQYLREGCLYPIKPVPRKGYVIDWDWGRQEGFIPMQARDPRKVAASQRVATFQTGGEPDLPTNHSLTEALAWSTRKVASWEAALSAPYTYVIGVNHRCCELLEVLIAHTVSILSCCPVRTDDARPHGRFEEQVEFLNAANQELSSLVARNRPACLRGKRLLSSGDKALLLRLQELRAAVLTPPPATSLKAVDKEARSLFAAMFSAFRDLVKSDFMMTCASLEPHKYIFQE